MNDERKAYDRVEPVAWQHRFRTGLNMDGPWGSWRSGRAEMHTIQSYYQERPLFVHPKGRQVMSDPNWLEKQWAETDPRPRGELLATIKRLTKELEEARLQDPNQWRREYWRHYNDLKDRADFLAAELAKAREEIERRWVDINHLDTRLADALDELAKAREALTEIVNLDQHPVILGGGRKEMGPFAHIARAALPATPEPQPVEEMPCASD